LCPQLRIGRQVVDLSAAADGFFHGPAITDIGTHDFETVQRQVRDDSAGALQDAHGLALVQQEAHEVAADETGATGDQDRRSHKTINRAPPVRGWAIVLRSYGRAPRAASCWRPDSSGR